MRAEMPMRRVVYLAALAGVAVSLAGCDSLREAAGLTKISPDEFAVATKAPLIIPPDYNLKPPQAGRGADQPDLARPPRRAGALYRHQPASDERAWPAQRRRTGTPGQGRRHQCRAT